MADPNAFAKLVPGFDFLQGLMKNASAAMPNMGQWIAPTLNPEELEKRIEELRTVQFWLEQNARMLGATIQALEVQRMTLSTLRTMNVSMSGLTDALTARVPKMEPAAPEPPPAPEPAPEPSPVAAAPEGAAEASAANPGAVDPMQWWGALTRQFTELAATAMKDSAADTARNLAGAMAQKSMASAGEALKAAVKAPKPESSAKAAKTTGKPATKRAPRKSPSAKP